MGHRTKVVIAVDGEQHSAVAGKIGQFNYEIIKTLADAVERAEYMAQYSPRALDVGDALYEGLRAVARVSDWEADDRDDAMDVHVWMNISSEDGSIAIVYKPDLEEDFVGDFEALKADYGLD